jgi:2-polyprenyl-6-methoxyphenol hydroxylase-like FAD-dependent oxidoreductase
MHTILNNIQRDRTGTKVTKELVLSDGYSCNHMSPKWQSSKILILISQLILLSLNCIILTSCTIQTSSSLHSTMPQIQKVVDVVICGGGLGGLALANGLINGGFSVICFEKNSEFQPKGAALAISPNAFRALEELTPGVDTSEGQFNHVFPDEVLTYSWANVRNLLLPSDLDLNLSSEFVDFEDIDDGFIESRFDCHKNGMEKEMYTVRSRVLIGADGIHSDVSKFLNGRGALPTGALNWRCTVDSNPNAIEGEVSVEFIGDRTFCSWNVADRKTCWASIIQKGSSTIIESMTRKTKQEIKEEALEVFSDFPPKFVNLIARTNPDLIYHGPLLVHDLPLLDDQGWGGSGRVALLGDSAHGIRPVSGQGAAMAFEDGVILCRKLKEVKDLSVRTDVCNALREYENERLARVKRVSSQQAGRANKMYSVTVNSAGVGVSNLQKIVSGKEMKEREAAEEKQYLEWLFKGV